MLPRRISLLLLLPLLIPVTRLTAQQSLDPTTAGRTYVVAFPDTTQNTYDERFTKTLSDTLAMFIYSPVATKVRITGNGYINNVNVPAGKFAEVYLNGSSNKASAPIVTQSNVESRNVFRFEADDPIVVYCYICTKYGCEAWTPLPVESWGLEYYAAANPQEKIKDVWKGGISGFNSKNKAAPAEACVISAYDNTTITIVPSLRQQKDNLPDWNGFPNLTITLSENRAYQVQGFIDTLTAHNDDAQPDIAGVYIYADKPIGVISGNTRAQVNLDTIHGPTRNSFKNLMIEQIAPVDQHGREFVFTPTMDSRALTGLVGDTVSEKRANELVRIYGTSLGTAHGWQSAPDTASFTVENATTYDDLVPGGATAAYYHTDTPAQAYKSCMSVTKNQGTTSTLSSYYSWGTYMVEMVPREQWGTFAPFIAPLHPDSMQHYVNVVTDVNSTTKIVDENGTKLTGWRAVPGSDLMWATRSVTPGETHFFRSIDSTARFHADLYGLLRGSEHGSTLGDGQYQEALAVAYGYPIAPRRAVLRAPDSLVITIAGGECDSMVLNVQALNVPKPVGFRSIALLPGSSNARLTFLNPIRATDVLGMKLAQLKLTAIDKMQDASGTLRITDRTGKITDIPYSYVGDRIDIAPDTLVNYGDVAATTAVDTVIRITNPLNRALSVEDLFMYSRGARPFTIIEPSPTPTKASPLLIQPGENLQVKVRFRPMQENEVYVDTLNVKTECASIRLPVRGTTARPCIYMDDLNFGTLILGRDSARTIPLNICNRGLGSVRFINIPGADSVVTWLEKNFSVPRSTLDSLWTHVVLGPDGSGTECFKIWVTFTPRAEGSFRTIARFSTDADCSRDSSVWSAVVARPSDVEWSTRVDGEVYLRPTPVQSQAEIALRLKQPARVELSLVNGQGVEVHGESSTLPTGDALLPLDVSSLPSGLYYCRLTVDGVTRTLPLPVVR